VSCTGELSGTDRAEKLLSEKLLSEKQIVQGKIRNGVKNICSRMLFTGWTV